MNDYRYDRIYYTDDWVKLENFSGHICSMREFWVRDSEPSDDTADHYLTVGRGSPFLYPWCKDLWVKQTGIGMPSDICVMWGGAALEFSTDAQEITVEQVKNPCSHGDESN